MVGRGCYALAGTAAASERAGWAARRARGNIAMPGAWSWNGDPLVLLGLAALGSGYYAVVGPLRARHGWGDPATPRQVAAFAGGLMLPALTPLSPLDGLGRAPLFHAPLLPIRLANPP